MSHEPDESVKLRGTGASATDHTTHAMQPPLAALLLAFGGEETTSRRRLIKSAATSFVAIFPSLPSNANDLYLAQPMGIKDGRSDESVKPSAPLEYLLPAAR